MFRNICRNTDNKLYYILKYVIKMTFYILVLKKKKCVYNKQMLKEITEKS